MIYGCFNILSLSVIILSKSHQIFECFVKIINSLTNIHPVKGIKHTNNLTITFNNICYIKCTCNMSLINYVFILKANYYRMWSLHNTLHNNIKKELCSIRYSFMECFSFLISNMYIVLFIISGKNYSEQLLYCHF